MHVTCMYNIMYVCVCTRASRCNTAYLCVSIASEYYPSAFSARAGVPLPPIIVNHTEGATWISLVWQHNQSCCTNGSYSLLWKTLQSEEAAYFGVRTVDPDPGQHPNITHLIPATTYIVTVVVKCHRDQLQSIILNTSISKLVVCICAQAFSAVYSDIRYTRVYFFILLFLVKDKCYKLCKMCMLAC